MAYLSREDLDNFAERILRGFVKAEYPKGHICYNVNPTRLAQFYGFNILYSSGIICISWWSNLAFSKNASILEICISSVSCKMCNCYIAQIPA